MTLLTHRTPATPTDDPAEAPDPTGAPGPTASSAADDHACECCLDRRQLLARAGAAGLGVAAVGLLAACGSGSDPGSKGGDGSASPRAAAAAGALAQVADIPVGGAVKATGADGAKLIISQPQAGTIVAMTAVCPHKGCEVKPDGKQLLCPCHASIFTLDGANVSGPAKTPLAPVDVHVAGGAVLAGKA